MAWFAKVAIQSRMSVDEKALTEHLRAKYPKENEASEWKEYTSLKQAINGRTW